VQSEVVQTLPQYINLHILRVRNISVGEICLIDNLCCGHRRLEKQYVSRTWTKKTRRWR